MLIDQASIKVIAGHGGNGCLAFRREKFVPRGGPSGGNGGKGGDVYLECSDRVNTLLQFRYKRLFKAARGRHGEGSCKHGRDGDSLTLLVPPGTQVSIAERVVHDLSSVGQSVKVAAGGRGGRGNASFASSRNQAPRFVEPGQPGEELDLFLNLKLIADVGLVGLPNSGKSTLISRISAAKPKIADYPFTTLSPNLGVVELPDYRSFVVADIPGLIEGAHDGHGLGDRFLKHIERTKILVHLIDSAQPDGDCLREYETIERELVLYSEELGARSRVVVASKTDIPTDNARLQCLEALSRERNLPFVAISSATDAGLADLVALLGRMLDGTGSPGALSADRYPLTASAGSENDSTEDALD